MQRVDVAITGAGIIGLSIALELRRRGLSVAILERGEPAQEATFAAGGMLAVHDPENPLALLPLSQLSISLYPEYLDRIAQLSGVQVPYRTSQTYQGDHAQPASAVQLPESRPHLRLSTELHWQLIEEHSLDPRELAAALLRAVLQDGASLYPHTPILSAQHEAGRWTLAVRDGAIEAEHLVLATGAWSPLAPLPVFPRKGQMLAVQLPAGTLDQVVRSPDIYLIPRGEGRTIIGATLEDAGFDKAVDAAALADLQARAAALVPRVASAPVLESWSGLRPATADLLPLLGAVTDAPPNLHAATGHFRNGILLAPATARLISQRIAGEPLSLNLDVYRPGRFHVSNS